MRAAGAYSVLENDLCVGEGGNGGSGPLGRAGNGRAEGQYRCSAEVVAVRFENEHAAARSGERFEQ